MEQKESKLPLDGRDAWPVITEGAKSPHEAILICANPKKAAVRVGDWKLLLNAATRDITVAVVLDRVPPAAEAEVSEDLRAMLNAGYRFGAMARRMGGPRMTTLEAFPVFCAKAFAGIGEPMSDGLLRCRPVLLICARWTSPYVPSWLRCSAR